VFINPISHQPDNGMITTKVGVTCGVGTPTSVYGLSDVYHVDFSVDLPFSLPPAPPEWRAPYVVSQGTSLSR